MDRKQAAYDLEEMIDCLNIDVVLELISNVCDKKAEHVAELWQDHKQSKRWAHASKRVYDCSCNTAVIAVGSGR